MEEHYHKYFIFQVKYDFEPVDIGTGHDNLFERIEYAVSGCACGDILKQRVIQPLK